MYGKQKEKKIITILNIKKNDRDIYSGSEKAMNKEYKTTLNERNVVSCFMRRFFCPSFTEYEKSEKQQKVDITRFTVMI